MTFTPRELLARGPHRMPTPLGRPPRVLQSVKIISSGFASVLDGILAEASFRCTATSTLFWTTACVMLGCVPPHMDAV